MGLVTPIGIGKKQFWDSLSAGVSGISRVASFDVTDYPSQIAGEVLDFDPTDYIDKREARRMDRFTQLGVAAALEAWRDAGLEGAGIDREDAGVLIGSGIGGIKTIEEQLRVLWEKVPGGSLPLSRNLLLIWPPVIFRSSWG